MYKFRSTTQVGVHAQLGLLHHQDIVHHRYVRPYGYNHGIAHLLLCSESQKAVSILLSPDYIYQRLSVVPQTSGYVLSQDYQAVRKWKNQPLLQYWQQNGADMQIEDLMNYDPYLNRISNPTGESK